MPAGCLGLLVIPRETLARIVITFDWLISVGRSNFSVKRVPEKLCTCLETVHAQTVADVERVCFFCRFTMTLACSGRLPVNGALPVAVWERGIDEEGVAATVEMPFLVLPGD